MPLGILYNIGDIRFELSKVGKFGTLEFGDPKVQFLDSTFLYKFLHKIDDVWLEMLGIQKHENLDLGNPEVLFWEGVISLYKFFTQSMLSGSKNTPNQRIPNFARACSCLA